MIDADLLAKYDKPVPRYTSYPTAPHFTPRVDAEAYRRWLCELPAGETLSLYVHIPFCDTMCWFCACHTRIVNRYEPIKRYLGLLAREVELVTEALGPRRGVTHIHWGGGTPTILVPEDIVYLADSLRRHFDFTADSEFAVEIDPRGVKRELVAALGKAGVTRASLGVQDFSPKVQEAVNRIQPYEETKQVIDWLREEGIREINLDLMYGLPHQGVKEVLDTIDKVLTLEPKRLAIFGYAHVPWMKTHQRMIDESALPDTNERWDLFTTAAARLAERGFVQIGLDHFARQDDNMALALKEGRLHRNFQGYTNDVSENLVGIGASSIGRLPQGYVQNDSQINLYRHAIEEDRLATSRGVAVSEEDRLRRTVIEQLMCNFSADPDEICADFGRIPDIFASEREALTEMAEDGLIEIDGGRITVSDEARPLVRTVCAVFDTYLQSGVGRHSRAV